MNYQCTDSGCSDDAAHDDSDADVATKDNNKEKCDENSRIANLINHNNNNNSTVDRQQKELWIQEQNRIAKLVEVYEDDDDDDNDCNNSRFALRTIKNSNNNGSSHDEDNTNDNNRRYYYGGVDVSFPVKIANDSDNDQELVEEEESVAVYVIIDRRTMEIIYQDSIYFTPSIPYVSSFLTFREIGPINALIRKQVTHNPQYTPSAILVDGNGILHCRYAGIASFVGVMNNIPAIGIGKTLYYHDYHWTKNYIQNHITSSLTEANQYFLWNANNAIRCDKMSNTTSNNNNLGGDTSNYDVDETKTTAVKKSSSLRLLFDTVPIGSQAMNNVYDDKDLEEERQQERQQTPCDDNTPSMVGTASENHSSKNNSNANDNNSKPINHDTICDNKTNNNNDIQRQDRKKLIENLSKYTDAIAMPLQIVVDVGVEDDKTTSGTAATKATTTRIIGCALMGYGGRRRRQCYIENDDDDVSKKVTTNRTTTAATTFRTTTDVVTNPIFISVGHKISLNRAIEICVLLSITRIPEPVRQADLIGRELLRDRKNAHQRKETSIIL